MQSFVIGLIALLNLSGSNGVATAATPTSVHQEDAYLPARTMTLTSWDESALPPGTGTSASAKHEDNNLEAASVTQDSPVLASIAEADPSTEILDVNPNALGSASFMDARVIPLAQWKDTDLREPAPPAAPITTPRASDRVSTSHGSSTTTNAEKTKTKTVDAPRVSQPSGSGHRFPWGQCTYYVASRRLITFGANAGTWTPHGRDDG